MALWTPADLSVAPRVILDGSTVAWSGSNFGTTANPGSFGTDIVASSGTVTKGAQLNGYDTLAFSGSNSLQTNAGHSWTGNPVVFAVFAASRSAGLIGINFGPSSTAGWTIYPKAYFSDTWHGHTANLDDLVFWGSGTDLIVHTMATTPIGANTNHHILLARSGSSNLVKVDGTDETEAGRSTAGTAVSFSGTVMYLGAGGFNTEYLIGTIAYIAVLDPATSADEILRLEGWAAHKYGLTANLPAGHPYKSAAPTTGGTTTDGVGSASGTGAAAGIGRSIKPAVGSASGTGAATAVGRAVKPAVGGAAGTGAASAVGTGAKPAIGAASGAGAASAVGRATATTVGAASGTGAASATGSATSASIGSASGTGTANAVASGSFAGIGSASGAGTASAIGRGISNAVGAASGTGTASAVGSSFTLGPVYLDPAQLGPAIVLSNAYLTATQTAAATGNTRANVHHNSGDYYHEFTVNVAGDGKVGICRAELPLTEYLGEDPGVSIGVDDGGGWIGAGGTTTAPALIVGHTYGMATHIDGVGGGAAWLKDITAGGYWNADASADPVTGVNGAEFFVGYLGPGDLDVGATAWWGLRAYSSDTTGDAAIDVVRASDSTTQTIYTLDDGSLDVASLTTFLASTTGKVSKLYDQTGNGHHLLQATGANRPAITLNAVGTLPALTFNGSTTFMMSSTTVDIWQPYTLAAVVKERVVAPSGVHCFIGADGGFDVQLCFGNVGYLTDKVFQSAGAGNPSANAVHDVLHSIFGVFNNFGGSIDSYLVVDGVVTYGSIGSGAQFNGHFLLGAAEGPSNVFDGIICEAGFWPYLVTP